MGRNSSEKRISRKKKKRVIILSIIVPILAIVGMAGGYVWAMFSKMEKVDIDKENLGSNKELSQKYKGVTNIALFGVDSADGNGRSDAMMVATLDTENKKIKLTSIMRDSYVSISGHGMNKLNAAYAFGKEELAIKTINENFDLNIEDFISVDFATLPKVIDKIGGVEVNIDSNAELKELNTIITNMGLTSKMVSGLGIKSLNGAQAMAYCRIRYTQGDDFKRTERQREVMDSMLGKVLSISPAKYPGLLNEILPMVKTSLSASTIMGMGTEVVKIGNNLEQNRFPTDDNIKAEKINGAEVLTFDKSKAKEDMHKWIFEDVKQ